MEYFLFVSYDFHHVHSLLIPKINKHLGLFTTSKARNSLKFIISPRNMG